MLPLLGLLSCNVHQWPEPEPTEQVKLSLIYDTDMPMMEHNLSSGDTKSSKVDSKEMRTQTGVMRYHVRAYPMQGNDIISSDYYTKFEETIEISGSYDRCMDLRLVPGKYRLIVWSDLRETSQTEHFYDVTDFNAVKLSKHQSNTDYRDSFRGWADMEVINSVELKDPKEIVIKMQRPMAKFEFVTTDLAEFLDKETKSRGEENYVDGATGPDLSDYTVKFIYVGFMPSAFSVFDDKPSDSVTGATYDGNLTRINNEEASMGFDYVFTGTNDTYVTLRVGINDKDGNQISLSDAVQVPIKRSYHTVVKGSYLLQNASGGVGVNPDYDGDHNIIFP